MLNFRERERERGVPQTMILWWMFFLSFWGNGGSKWVRGQFDSNGFISIDCGLSANDSYIDNPTELSYTSDAQFIDTGMNRNISKEYITPFLSRQYLTVRSFDSGTRNCYSLKSLVTESKYLIRAIFLYGNYDGLNKFAIFDIHIGVNFWKTVNISNAGIPIIAEVIAVALADYVQVCLVNTGGGTPFISSLDLRPLQSNMYQFANSTQSLSVVRRLNAGPTDTTIIRFPDDRYDRLWEPWSNEPYWTELTATSNVSNFFSDFFEVPSAVMQNAVTPVNSSVLEFNLELSPLDTKLSFWFVLHISEIQLLGANQSRSFNITANSVLWIDYSPPYLLTDAFYAKRALKMVQFHVAFDATESSTLPPLLNAVELFNVLPVVDIPTVAKDVNTINAIKVKYQIKRNWVGDPCAPKAYVWDGLICTYFVSSAPRITALNLASSGLTGDISTLFSELKALQSLNLAYNNLTGTIPDVLSQLASLTLLDLAGNQLNGTIPDGLLKKSQASSLTLRVGNNPNLCSSPTDCTSSDQKKYNGSNRIIVILVPVIVLAILVGIVVVLCRLRKQKATRRAQHYSKAGSKDDLIPLKNHQFTYEELVAITNNFQRILGKGGFGTVYHGLLENGFQVAVKKRSESTVQGIGDFLTEAKFLARVHHKFLVSLIGYCKEGSCVALVYEYMSEGALEEHIRGNSRPFTWTQRIRIAVESAQGLEYLHKGCNPPLIHRDVKTDNILLNANLEAKIADFGLSKAICSDTQTHITTRVVGTLGYLDPEYHMTSQLTEKSDVYSFGVVLLELITGQRAIIRAQSEGAEDTNIVSWVRQRLATGNMESIVDAKMQGDYNVNSVWKVADLALKCTMMCGSQRPTMPEVVIKLKECMVLEATGETESVCSKYYSCKNSSNGTVRSESYYTGYSSNGNTSRE